MKRKKQFCAVWMKKTNINEVSKKKKVCKDTYKKKKINEKKSRKKMSNCEISLKDKQNLCRPVV